MTDPTIERMIYDAGEASAQRALAAAVAESVRLREQLEAVRALHVKFDGGGDRSNRCAHDGFKWPCATARALEAK